MTNIMEFMSLVTNGILEFILFSLWPFTLLSLIKWFLIRAKAGLHYLFPRCIWFKKRKEEK